MIVEQHHHLTSAEDRVITMRADGESMTNDNAWTVRTIVTNAKGTVITTHPIVFDTEGEALGYAAHTLGITPADITPDTTREEVPA